MVQTKFFLFASLIYVISTETGGYNRDRIKKEGRNPDMKEFLFQIATFLLATIQAAGLVWIAAVFAH